MAEAGAASASISQHQAVDTIRQQQSMRADLEPGEEAAQVQALQASEAAAAAERVMPDPPAINGPANNGPPNGAPANGGPHVDMCDVSVALDHDKPTIGEQCSASQP